MKRLTTLVLLAAAYSITSAQSLYPGQYSQKLQITVTPQEAECFTPDCITLLPGRFMDNQLRDSAWMASIQVDRLLHSFNNNAGIWAGNEGGYKTVEKLGGWESLDCDLRGHTTGHLMSAYALMYATTGQQIFKDKGDSIVAQLALVQQALGNGYLSAFPEELINRNIKGERVWAPWYTLHKILSGLIDQYLHAGNLQALDVASRMGDWAYRKLQNIEPEARTKMLRNEFGGINEAFYNLYACTAQPRYMEVAEFFRQEEVVEPLAAHDNDFGTKHTNTFIPKVLGEMRRYEITGNTSSMDISKFFWDQMLEHHILAPGCLSDKEHFFPPQEAHLHISGYTGETCCTYNMLKLARHIFCQQPNAAIFDYYERALYNHILGQQDPETGMVAYFLPLKTGTHKVYSTPENSFWCCVGSGFENHAKLAESTYMHTPDNTGIFVNLFLPTKLKSNNTGLEIIQQNNFPATPTTTLTITSAPDAKRTINIRKPAWTRNINVLVNGKKVSNKTNKNGYIQLQRIWKANDKIELQFNMAIDIERVNGDEHMAALVYGPVVLAGRLGTDNLQQGAPFSNPQLYNDYYTYEYNIPEGIDTKINPNTLVQTGTLQWTTPQGIILEPLADVHRERHAVYWTLDN